MVYLVILGIFFGQTLCRLNQSNYVGFYNWSQKLINYMVVPIILSFQYWLFMTFLSPNFPLGIHYMIGLVIGFTLQHVTAIIRKEYYESLLEY